MERTKFPQLIISDSKLIYHIGFLMLNRFTNIG